jgi:hypothetical protein
LVIALSMPHDAIALETPMDQHLPVYSWLRGGASLHLAQIADIAIRPGPPGQQQTSVRVRIMRTLWGRPPGSDLDAVFAILEPISEAARLKFPHPVWGQVDLATRPPILLVLHGAGAAQDEPWYVEPALQRDPMLAALVDIVQGETPGTERPDQRVRRYLDWLQPSRHPALRLFAAEALAKDDDIPGDPSGRIAEAVARVFQTDPDIYVRLAVGTWMWDGIWQRTSTAGRSAVVDSAVDGLRDADQDVSRFSFEHLLALDTPDLIQRQSAGAAQILRDRSLRVADPDERSRIDALIRRISP